MKLSVFSVVLIGSLSFHNGYTQDNIDISQYGNAKTGEYDDLKKEDHVFKSKEDEKHYWAVQGTMLIKGIDEAIARYHKISQQTEDEKNSYKEELKNLLNAELSFLKIAEKQCTDLVEEAKNDSIENESKECTTVRIHKDKISQLKDKISILDE